MKNIWLTALLAIVLLGGLDGGAAQAADPHLIVVNGVAEKSLDPDLVNLTLEVWSKAPSAKGAQQLAAAQFKRVKKTFEDFKIKKEDFQTENYSLNPETEYDQKTKLNRITGFRVSQTLSVALRKIDEAGNFLDALVSEKKSLDSGVNVNSIGWDSDKRQQIEAAALSDAVHSAKSKAEEIARAAGVKIRGVSRISHTAGYAAPPPVFRNYALKAAAMDSAPTELAAGQIKIRVEVTAEYEIN